MGKLRKDAAETLHLQQGIPVVAGGPDYLMSLLGTGVIAPGMTCDRAGTSEGINYCSETPARDSRLLCLPHIIGEYHNISGVISTTGKALEWLGSVFNYGNDYKGLFEDVEKSEPGAKGLIFLPYLAGERSPIWDPNARGVFSGLSIRHKRADLARAVAESIGFAIRDVLEVMAENGYQCGEMRVAGSQSKISVLNQIKSNVTDRRILVPKVADSELVGAACIGFAAVGEFGSFEEASSTCVRIEREFEPDPGQRSRYTEMFSLYRELYSRLKVFFERSNFERSEE
jgi:xylulokinase